jgi:hemerythrin-like domain-containing protein
MNNAIDTMMAEHQLIVRVLASLEVLADRLTAGQEVPRNEVARFADFFRNFADRCHHGKEEDRLFAKMTAHGFPREHGPVGVMLYEHDEGRTHVKALHALGEGKGPLTEAERAMAAEQARAFVPLLLQHIQKEDNVLYPMARQALPAAELTHLDAECAAFDHEVSAAEAARLRQLAEDLMAAYPPAPERLAAACSYAGFHGGGCGH